MALKSRPCPIRAPNFGIMSKGEPVRLLIVLGFALYIPFSIVEDKFSGIVEAAERGDRRAQSIVGLSYHFGEDRKSKEVIEKDPIKAFLWLALSSKNADCFSP
jgi:hypothetical protein